MEKDTVGKFGLSFESNNPLYQARIAADPDLTADQKLTLPNKSGTIATTDDIGGGGDYTTLVKTADQSFAGTAIAPFYVDQNDSHITTELEANSVYHVTGALSAYDEAEYNSTFCLLTLPAGTKFLINCVASCYGGSDGWADDFNSSWGGVGEMGFRAGYPVYMGKRPTTLLDGFIYTAGTAGTLQLVIRNMSGDSTLQGLRKGSFLRLKKIA